LSTQRRFTKRKKEISFLHTAADCLLPEEGEIVTDTKKFATNFSSSSSILKKVLPPPTVNKVADGIVFAVLFVV
jgi:hypothetical protein